MAKETAIKKASVLSEEINRFSKGKLKQKEDIERLIDISLEQNKIPLLEEAAFTAKFLYGLLSIIQRGESPIDGEVFSRYMKEYTENLEKLKGDLKEILKEAGSFINEIFTRKYFALSQESLENMHELCHDLNWYKMYVNEKGGYSKGKLSEKRRLSTKRKIPAN
ncbi:MAG: hypothetical protein Q8933_16535 [Bacteroidota bacterium]|nr:hypothetical protein [Bacteroidota bacterium]